jgi:hypothetical protein
MAMGPGEPSLLGARITKGGVYFAVFSQHGERVSVRRQPTAEALDVSLPAGEHHCSLPLDTADEPRLTALAGHVRASPRSLVLLARSELTSQDLPGSSDQPPLLRAIDMGRPWRRTDRLKQPGTLNASFCGHDNTRNRDLLG